MIVTASIIICAPLTLLAFLLSAAAAKRVLAPNARRPNALANARYLPFIMGGSGVLIAVAERLGMRDAVHLFWSAQIPLVGLFLTSGILLCQTWRDDAHAVQGMLQETLSEARRRRWLRAGAPTFLAMLVILGSLPVLLSIALPDEGSSWRAPHDIVPRLFDLAAWGLGGELPIDLLPPRGQRTPGSIGHLSRDLTVTMGSTLIAAWLWIIYCGLALCGRLVRSQPKRIALFLVAPPLVGVLVLSGVLDPLWGGFDSRFFEPEGSRSSGIWTSAPVVMRSYGPVLLMAACAGIALISAQRRSDLAPESEDPSPRQADKHIPESRCNPDSRRALGYCLYCFAAPLDKSSRCPECHAVSLPSLRAEYWNLNERYRRYEVISKTLALLTIPAGIMLFMNRSGHLGSGIGAGGGKGGWLCMVPFFVTAGLWKTSEKWTRRSPYFRPRWVWGLSLGGYALLYLAVEPLIGAGIALLTLLVIILCKAGERWKKRLIVSGRASNTRYPN